MKNKNNKLTFWEKIQFIIFLIIFSIGFIYIMIFCLNLIVDTYDYVTNIPTKDEVSHMIRDRQYELILDVEKLRYKCNQEGKYFGVHTYKSMLGNEKYEEIRCTSNKEYLKQNENNKNN